MMYLHVHVTAGAKRESILEEKGKLLVSVREPAERGLANARVQELVAAHYHVGVKAARMLSGHQSPHKLFSIQGIQ